MLNQSDFYLRAMTENDLDMVHEWRNQEHVKAYMFTDTTITKNEHKKWFELTLQNKNSDYQIIEYQNKAIGLANATKIDTVTKSCYWGFYLGATDCKKGSGTFLALFMLDHLFNTHEVENIYAEVFDFNLASLKLHDKFGFIKIPQHSRSATKNGKQEKISTFSLSLEKWKDIKHTIVQTDTP